MPKANGIHDLLLRPAVLRQKVRNSEVVFAGGVPPGGKRPWTGFSCPLPGGGIPGILQIIEPCLILLCGLGSGPDLEPHALFSFFPSLLLFSVKGSVALGVKLLILLRGDFDEYLDVNGIYFDLAGADFGRGSGDKVTGHHQESGADTVVHLDLAFAPFSGTSALYQDMNAGAGDAVFGVGVQLLDLLGDPRVNDHPFLDAMIEVDARQAQLLMKHDADAVHVQI